MTFFTEQDTNRNKSIPLSPECGTLKNDGCRRIHFPEIIRSHHMISAKPINDVYHMHDSYELLLFLGGCTDCYIEHHRYRLQPPMSGLLPISLLSWFGITARSRPICSPVLRSGRMRTEIYSPCRPGPSNAISI